MLKGVYKDLKSGTDIRGIASEGVKDEHINLTDEIVEEITLGFVQWLCDVQNKKGDSLKVSVGHDSRISADRISNMVQKTLQSTGVKVVDCGLASTPSMFMTTKDIACDAAIQITASHHPFNRNGLKFFVESGGLQASDIEAILENAQEKKFPPILNNGSVKRMKYMQIYSKHLRDIICKGINAEDYLHPLKGFKIVVDAGNGAGGFYASDVLEPLGADTTGSQFLNPDGMFPNHIPNPENPVAIKSISDATKANNADLGVIFDTDVDRGGAVDSTGKEINRNRLVALAAAIALEGNEGGTIVTDSITSDGLKEYIEDYLGAVHCRFKRGYKNVINESLRLNSEGINSPLAIETSGHAALRENYFLDDGAYLVTKIIIKMANLKKEGKSIEELLKPLKEPKESLEIRIKITETDFKPVGNALIAKVEEFANETKSWKLADDSKEGVRVSFGKRSGDGWFLLRLSVHDPVMPINIESNVEGGVKKILQNLYDVIKTESGFDFSAIEKALQD